MSCDPPHIFRASPKAHRLAAAGLAPAVGESLDFTYVNEWWDACVEVKLERASAAHPCEPVWHAESAFLPMCTVNATRRPHGIVA